MPGFIRRYGYNPGNEVITQIEGVVIIDSPPPGGVEGVSTGVACLVGEFVDCSLAVTVDGTGTVTTKIQPSEVFSGQDLLNKVGGFDETIGDFGDSDGNAYAALRGKKYSRLICAPVNMTSNVGCRFWRELPLCIATGNPLPVVPVSPARMAAGREFLSASSGRMRTAAPVQFTSLGAFHSNTAGATTNAAAAATQTFTGNGSENFQTIVRPDGGVGIKKGDILVIGNNNAGARLPLPSGGSLGAGTYRVAVDAAAATTLTVEALDGENFAFVTAATIPYRIHVSSDADSAPVMVLGAVLPGGYASAEAGGSSVPVRPLTNFTGGATDGNWTADAPLTPLVVPAALTGSTADPLSGLAGHVHATTALAFVAAVQLSNQIASATIDALYQAALDATVSNLSPVSDINIIWCARTSSTIRTALKTNALNASAGGVGRMAIIRPELDVQTTTAATSGSSPGVGAVRDERVIYAWPGTVQSVPEAVNFRLRTADGLTTVDGLLDTGMDAYIASILSLLPPERNPGQAAPPIPEAMAGVLGIQRGVTQLELADYIALRSNGIAALRIDKTAGPIIQSGITTSLTSGQKNISRRRMADFIEDSLAQRLVQLSKLPNSQANRDNVTAEAQTFIDELVSIDNPSQARLAEGSVDDVSGNTPAGLAAGIFVLLVRGKTLGSMDFIVVQAEIGANVLVVKSI